MRGLFIGLTTIDIIYPLQSFPEEDSKIYSDRQLLYLGGPATNAAITFSALHGEATLISLVGKGSFNQTIVSRLRKYKVKHVDLNPMMESDPTISAIMVSEKNGARTIVTSRA